MSYNELVESARNTRSPEDAQVLATLALAEQQRVANLIAMMELLRAGEKELSTVAYQVTTTLLQRPKTAGQASLLPDIADALGVE